MTGQRTASIAGAPLPRAPGANASLGGATSRRLDSDAPPPPTSMARASYGGERFVALLRYLGSGGWHFVPVPEEPAPHVTHACGRTSVRAIVDGISWETSVWPARTGPSLLAVPKRVRGIKRHGDRVAARIASDAL